MIKGCDKSVYSGGLCSVHYSRLRVRGSVEDKRGDHLPWEDRIKEYFKESDSNSCWIWQGGTNKFGHGAFYIGGGRLNSKRTNAHRAVWILYNGPIEKGKQVNHKCKTRSCVNPAHLYVGTQSENMKDKMRDGNGEKFIADTKSRRGVKHHNNKLSEEQVRTVKSSDRSNADLAKEFNVSQFAIYAIRKGITWSHIE